MNELDFSALETETVTTVDSRGFEEINAALPHADAVYRDEDSGKSADEVDPRLLFQNPTVDEIRWYYRYNGIAKTIIKKPIKDAFKNGFELISSISNNNLDDNDLEELNELVYDWVYNYYIPAQIKSRRDGPSAIFYKTVDDNGLNQAPSDVEDLVGMEVMTLDKWDKSTAKNDIIEGVESEVENPIDPNIEIRESGLVIYRDISSASNHRKLLGYIFRENESHHSAQFIHSDRCDHFVWNSENDGDVNEFTVGEWEGDSVLLPIFIPLKSLMMANWAMGHTVFRYSAPLYAVTTPERYGQNEFDLVSDQIDGLNSASDIVLPPGCEIQTEGAKGEIDPAPFVDKLIEQCCGGTEFTKSVLLGTQTGTVSGSSTDIKNYFNQVQRFRTGDATDDINAHIDRLNGWGLTSIQSKDIDIEWGPLFKIDTLDKMESVVRLVTAGSNAINNYILKPDEVRDLVAMEWAELEIDMELETLSKEDYEEISELIGGSFGESNTEEEGNPEVGQNGGGNPEGNTTDPSNPA